MTAKEWLLRYSTLPIGTTARNHFLSINQDMSGDIVLNPNKWANIAIPVEGKRVKEYLLDWIAAETGKPAEDSVEVVKAYPATATQSGRWLAFVPGVTNPANSGNFNLVMDDNGAREIVGFLIKIKDYTTFYDGTLVFHWDRND